MTLMAQRQHELRAHRAEQPGGSCPRTGFVPAEESQAWDTTVYKALPAKLLNPHPEGRRGLYHPGEKAKLPSALKGDTVSRFLGCVLCEYP